MDIILKVTVFPILMKICYTPLLYRNFISNLSATEFQFPTLATNTFEDRFILYRAFYIKFKVNDDICLINYYPD
ncbi:unnamed protein product [Rhizophagus irregularis]|nr:unnamed protein product [Rhizophagus irregularis]